MSTQHETRSHPILDCAAVVPAHVVYRTFVAETVVLNLNTGKYHGLNPTGGRFLDAIQKAGTVRAAVPLLAAEFEVPAEQIERDLVELCADLAERDLLALDAVAVA